MQSMDLRHMITAKSNMYVDEIKSKSFVQSMVHGIQQRENIAKEQVVENVMLKEKRLTVKPCIRGSLIYMDTSMSMI